MHVLFDSNGFPDKSALERLNKFWGSPKDYLDLVRSLFWTENTDSGEFSGRYGRHMHWVSFKTGGWAGHQDVLDVVFRSLFHMAYWHSSERGGTTVYHVPGEDWEGNRGFWGGTEVKSLD
jgi:hypothetical protein